MTLVQFFKQSALACTFAFGLQGSLLAQETNDAQSMKRAFEKAYGTVEVQSKNHEVPTPTSPGKSPTVQPLPTPTPRVATRPSTPRPAVVHPSGFGNTDAFVQAAELPSEPPKPQVEENKKEAPSKKPQEEPAVRIAHSAMGMWWQPMITEPLERGDTSRIDPENLVQLALQNSPRILAISQQPLIQETDIARACAEFDPDLFLRTQFDDRVDPVGNELTTGGGLPFLEDHIWYADGGLRRKTSRGAEVELKQRVGFQNSNSNFFVPQDQGTATLSLNYTQPLLRGRGVTYNRSQILIAQIGYNASWDQLASELQDELTEVVEAYWKLYYNRSVLYQKQYNVERGEVVLNKLEGRSSLDSLPSQIARARSAVQSRRTELANAFRDVKNAETDIRRLTGSSDSFRGNAAELLPMESPTVVQLHRDMDSVIQEAMSNRPEVKQAVKRTRVAAVQQQISEHELMPELNMIFSGYVSALRGESQVLEAWGDQFSATPGYGVGFEFAVPYRRRAARARNSRQQYFLQQVRHEVDQTVQDVVAEAQIAWRQLDSAYQTVMAAAEAIRAARSDLLQNEARWESFALVEGDFTEGQTPTTLLDQLLDAQQRLTNAELTYSQAILEFKTAEIGLKRATGTLLMHHQYESGTALPPNALPVDSVMPAETILPEAPVAPALQQPGRSGL